MFGSITDVSVGGREFLAPPFNNTYSTLLLRVCSTSRQAASIARLKDSIKVVCNHCVSLMSQLMLANACRTLRAHLSTAILRKMGSLEAYGKQHTRFYFNCNKVNIMVLYASLYLQQLNKLYCTTYIFISETSQSFSLESSQDFIKQLVLGH